MRPIVIGLIAALMAATMQPAAALAATTPAKPGATVDAASIKKGMDAAPGVITKAGLDCNLANARMLGTSTDPKTKAASDYYELACTDQEGFIIAIPQKDGVIQIETCLETLNTPGSGAQCLLPQNADAKSGLKALVAKYKPSCVLTNARAIGQTSDRSATVFEVACQGGPGYNVQASFPVSAAKPAQFAPCFALAADSPMKCTLTDDATSTAYVTAMVAKMGKPCTVTNKRYVGATPEGNSFFEVACDDKKGYMIETAADGTVKPAIDCSVADGIGGGCTLTDSRSAETAQAGLYSKLAHNAGFACDVSRYAPFNVNVPGHEVVEMACSNRPDGAIGVFGATAADGSTIYDCAHSELQGYRCTFTKPDAAVPSLTADLNKVGKSSCVVNGERIVGVTTEKVGYIEVTCSDGNPGFMISYAIDKMTPKEALGCSLSKGILGGCSMPGNLKH
jgi:hypothetical protein